MSESISEIRNLKKLLNELPEKVGANNSKKVVGTFVAETFAPICGAEDHFGAMHALTNSIEKLPEIVCDQFQQGGRQQAALAIIQKLRSIFSPKNLDHSFENFLAATAVDRNVVLTMLPLLEDIRFDEAALNAKANDIVSEIEAFRSKLMMNGGLSHASKVVVDAQISLMERSILKFSETGVGRFRDSIFSSVGRIVIELQTNAGNEKIAVRTTLDDVLRIYGLMEAGGNLITLAAPTAIKLLTGPAG